MTKSTVKKAKTKDVEKSGRGEASMKPLTIIYWSRVALGIVAALICAALNIFVSEMGFFTCLSIAMLFYILTYYSAYKPLFIARVEKPTKVFMTGIGAYFITWLVTWILFYTLSYSPP